MPKPRKPRSDVSQEETRAHANFSEPASISPDEAFVHFANQPVPSLNALEVTLRDMGHKVSLSTLHRWSRKHKWLEKRKEAGKADHLKLSDLGSAAQALSILAKEGKTFDIVAICKGLQGRVARVIGDMLMRKMEDEKHPAPKPGYFIEMAKLLGDFEDLKRRGYQTDVQNGTRPEVPAEPEKPPEKKPETPPKLASVHIGPFTKPAKKA